MGKQPAHNRWRLGSIPRASTIYLLKVIIMICECCGKEKDDVEIVIDPYYEELYGELIEVPLCDKCYQVSIDEI